MLGSGRTIVGVERLKLKDFRGFASLDLRFEPRFTVLVGRNGSGKTSVLDAISLGLNSQVKPTDVRTGCEHATIELTALARIHRTEWGTVKPASHTVQPPIPVVPPPRLDQVQFTLFYTVERRAVDRTPGSSPGQLWGPGHASMNWQNAAAEYHSFFSWFREMEDLENEQSRFRDEAANPQLQSVRKAIESFFPGYSSLRIRRQFPLSSRPILTLEKGGVLLPFDSLSEGERNSIAMVADIARRLALLGSNGTATNGGAQGDPLAREGTILIDEIEQHLHPGWQRHLMRELPKTFPGLQFIVTTQSPVIVSEIGAENLRVLKDFALVESHHHHGRDANAVLEETFETSSRPDEVKADLDELATLIDDRRLEEAEALLRSLETQLGESDPDIVYYRNIFERLRPAG